MLKTKKYLLVITIFISVNTLFAENFPQHDNYTSLWIKNKIKHMSLEEKIGQLFIVYMYGKTPLDKDYEEKNLQANRGAKNFKEVIEKYHIGGVIYFNWTDNVGIPLDASQVNALSNGLQEIAMLQPVPIPLFISIDQEGGIVSRITEPASVFPGNMALGAIRSTYFAEQSAKIMGEELRSLGINTNFAPVLDVNINPDNPVIGVRSYSEDPDLVSQLGIAQIKGYSDAGIMSTAKHFPGHGDTDVDSHYGLPIIVHDLETLLAVDIKPFKAAIDAGVSSIMTAHIVVPALDNSGLPATLSRPILTDFLRGELGFNGLIITDSLDMSGANVLPAEKIPVEAFKAGADILLNPPNVDLAYTAMLNAVQRGEITKKRLNDSIYRILKAKMRQALFDNPYTDSSEIAIIGNKDNLLQAETMTNDSITLIKNDNSALPIEDNTKLLITGPNSEKLMLLSNLLKEKGIKVNSYITDLNPTQEQINTAVNHANNIEKIIVTTYNAKTNIAQQYLINALYNTNKPIIVVALRNPYDIAAFPYIDAYLTTYGDQDISIKALAAVLTGEIRPKGILPVSIPPLYKLGDRLAY